MRQTVMIVLTGVLALAVSGCKPRQAAPAATAPPALPDAVALSAQAHEFSGTDAVQLAAPGATVNVTGAYGIAVTVGTVAVTRTAAPGFAAQAGAAVPIRLPDTNSRFGRAQQTGIGTLRGMTAREAFQDQESLRHQRLSYSEIRKQTSKDYTQELRLDNERRMAPERSGISE